MNNKLKEFIKGYSFISGIGYEMECLIPYDKYNEMEEEYEIFRDGSLEGDSNHKTGELKFYYPIEDVAYLFREIIIIKEKYKIKQNNSCGNHIHVSFRDETMYYKFLLTEIQKLFVSSYVSYFRTEKYLQRIENFYSKFEFNDRKISNRIYEQLTTSYKNRSRYWSINLNPYKEYRTIEFRIFPYADDVWEFFEQVKFLLRFLKEIHNKKAIIKHNKDEVII